MVANGLVVSVGLEKYIGRAQAAVAATRPLLSAMQQLTRTADKLSQASESALKFRGDRSGAAAAGLNQLTASSKGTIDSFSRVAGQSSLVVSRMIAIVGVLAVVAKWQSILSVGGLKTAHGFGLIGTAASLATGKLGALAGGAGLFTNALKLLPFKLGAVGNSAMAAGLTLGVLSGGIGPLSAGLGLISAGMGGIPGKIGQVVTASGTLLVSFGAISAAITVLTASIEALVAIVATVGPGLSIGVKLAAEAEQAQIAFEVMLGSADAATQMLGDIRGFAIKTPFSEGELISSSRALIAFGESAGNVVPALQRIGDVSSGIGAPIGEIAEIYGKARVQGRLFAQDINQLTGRGIPVIQELAKQFGVTDSAVKKLVADGKVEFKHLEQAFISLTSQGGVFYGLTERQSRSLGGLWSTFKDSVGASLRKVGQEFVKTGVLQNAMAAGSRVIARLERPMVILGQVTAWAVDWLVSLADTFASVALVAEEVVTAFSDFSGVLKIGIPVIVLLSAAILTVVAAQKAWAVSQIAILALGGPAGWAKIAVGAAVAAAGIYAIAQLGKDASREMQTAADRAGDLQSKIDNVRPLTIVNDNQLRNMEKVQEYLDRFKPKAVTLQEELANLAQTFSESIQGTQLQAFNLDLKSKVHPAFQTREEKLSSGPRVHPAFQTEAERNNQLSQDGAGSRAKNVWDANIAAIKQIIQLHGQQLIAQRSVIDESTGVYTEIKNLSGQLDLMQGKTTAAFQKFKENRADGVPLADALKLKNIMDQIEAHKKLTEAKKRAADEFASKTQKADEIRNGLRTPLEVLKDNLKATQELVGNGLLTADEALKHNDKLIKEHGKQNQKSPTNAESQSNTGIQANTEEAVRAIIAATTLKDPQAKTEDLLKGLTEETVDQTVAINSVKDAIKSLTGFTLSLVNV